MQATLDSPAIATPTSRIRQGVRPPKFANLFARLDYEAQPMPVIAMYPIPAAVDLCDLELQVSGLDCQPHPLRWAELSHLPRYQTRMPIICQIFNWAEVVEWEGVRLADVLDYAVIATHAEGFVAVHSRDGVYFEGLSMAEVRDERVMLVTGLNGAPLPLEYGGPLRLVVPFLQGYKSVKWVGRINAFRHDPIGIKRLLAQSKIARLAPPWRARYSIVPPEGPSGDPDLERLDTEPLSATDIAPIQGIGRL